MHVHPHSLITSFILVGIISYITARPLRLSQTLFAASRIKCIAIRPISSPRYAIEVWTLVAVTDGSYIKERYPHLCSTAFILECSKGSGRMFGSFPECSQGANAYHGELMGLMAIHLILPAANKVWLSLRGRAVIYSDCLGALGRVANLPPHCIPTKCQHSDILKNILVNCTILSFTLAIALLRIPK